MDLQPVDGRGTTYLAYLGSEKRSDISDLRFHTNFPCNQGLKEWKYRYYSCSCGMEQLLLSMYCYNGGRVETE